MARHPHNRPQLYKAELIVFDIDDADFFDEQQEAGVKSCCFGSDLILAGSSFIANYCRQFNSNVHVQWTAMDMRSTVYSPPSTRNNIVAWGTSDSLAYGVERHLVAEVAKLLIKKIDFELWVYGSCSHPDMMCFANDLTAHGVSVQLIPPMRFDAYHESLRQCACGLHPIALGNQFSRGKSFGKLNSYMLTGVPVVVQNTLDYPLFFNHEVNGMLVDEINDWVDSIYDVLANHSLRDLLARQARIDFEMLLSSKNVAKNIDALLIKALRAE